MKRTDTSFITEATLWPKLFRLVCWYCGTTQARGGTEYLGYYMHKKCAGRRQ